MLQALRRRKAPFWLSVPLFVLAGPLYAGAPAPVGTLRCDGVVYLGQEVARSESVVYGGDQLRTVEGRATLSLTRGDLLVLHRHSGVTLQNSQGMFLVNLETGQLAMALSAPRSITVETEGLTFSPVGKFPSLSEIALRADSSIVVAVRRGTISVANLRPTPILVTEGQVLTINPRVARSQGRSPGTGAHGKMTLGEKLRTFRIGGLSHVASAAVVVGVLGGIGAAAVFVPISVTREPASPSRP